MKLMGGPPPIDEFMKTTAKHVVVLEVSAAGTGTNGTMARARVRIIEALRGSLSPGECDALFGPPSDEAWYAIRGGGDEGLARWNAKPCASPPTGARIIVAGDLHDGAFVVHARSIRNDTDAERQRLRELFAEVRCLTATPD